MLRLIILLCLLVVGLILFYRNVHFPHLKSIPITERLLSPFDYKVRYRIGEVDPRFGLDNAQVQQLALEAAQIWQQQDDEDYFIYDPNAKLTINLIYDERQSETHSRQHNLSLIENKQALWQQRHSEVEKLKHSISLFEQQITQQSERLNQATQEYNRKVQEINRQGSTSPEQRTILEARKIQLQQHHQDLELQIADYNQKILSIQQQVDQLNALNTQLAQEVSEFNQRFSGKQFHKGVFNGKEINIYQFSSQHDLRLTIAHELGHALGLDHHNDPLGLMYPILDQQLQQDFQLTPADLNLLHQR